MPDTAANYRMLHTMIRVKDLDRSLAFYTGPMGMKLLRKRDVPDGKYSLAFVGYGGGHQGRRQGHARGRPGSVRHHGDRLRRGSRRLQDRANRARVAAG